MDYFKTYLEHNLHVQYSEIVLEAINAEGNAMHVFQYAEKFLNTGNNMSKYELYEKHLVFDCDAPANIQEVIGLMQNSENAYNLDNSNLLFETWLVMHYQELVPENKNDKRKIIKLIRESLGVNKYTSRMKAHKGTIGKILGNDGNSRIRLAIQNAKELEKYWKGKGWNYKKI